MIGETPEPLEHFEEAEPPKSIVDKPIEKMTAPLSAPPPTFDESTTREDDTGFVTRQG